MKRALALCGGGSLGAYEIGVWKYLREQGMTFDIVTGTSIGAINGAMVAANAYDSAIEMWRQVDVNSIMENGLDIDTSLLRSIDVGENSKFRKAVKTYRKNRGADTRPLKQMLTDIIGPMHINRLPTKLGIVICEFPTFREVDVLVNDLHDDQVIDYLMASSACWPVFPIYEIKGKDYVDGGWRNNLPVDFALRLGADEVIAVKLNSLPKAQRTQLWSLPNVTLITPSLGQGSFLSFTHNRIENNIQLGYIDAAKTFGTLKGNRVTLENDNYLSHIAKKYYELWSREDPLGLVDLLKIQEKRVLLKIKDPKEKLFILSLEAVMDLLEFDFRQTYHTEELLKQIKEKALTIETSRGAKLRFKRYLLDDKDGALLTRHKELKFFASLLK